jgi:hypothetical protein
MARAISEIEDEIRRLPVEAQERLLHVLLEELDGPPDPGAEAAWLDEVRRRSRELDEGSAKPIPAKEIFARLRQRLKVDAG